MPHLKALSHSNTPHLRPFFEYSPEFCEAIKKQFNDPKAFGKTCIANIKTVILAGGKS